jgi:diacylglycerol kinase family enzyme
MSRRLLVLANPIAGGGRGRAAAERLVTALRAAGCTTELFVTQRRGDARARAAELDGWDALVVVGGDGTVNEALNGMRDLRCPLGVLAMGTANVLRTELALPRRPEQLAPILAHGTPHPVAVGRANGRRFLLFAGAGLDGAIVRRVEELRRGRLGKLRWTRPIFDTIRRWPIVELSVTYGDGSIAAGGVTELLVTRVRNYGGVMHLPADIALRDGRLHALAFRQRSRAAWAAATLRALCGRLRAGRDVEHRAVERVTVTAATPVSWQIDGDLGGTTPVEIALDAERIPLFGA